MHASDAAMDDHFGWSVDIDGDYAIVGAPRDGADEGAVYIFKHGSGGWAQTQKLDAWGYNSGTFYGTSVGIDEEANIVVGAYSDNNDFTSCGASYVYDWAYVYMGPWIGYQWMFAWGSETKYTDPGCAATGDTDDFYGFSVGIDKGGNGIVSGAYGDDYLGNRAGAVFYEPL